MVIVRKNEKGRILYGLFFFWIAAVFLQQALQRADDREEEEKLQNKIESYKTRYMELPTAAYPSWVHRTWIRVPAAITIRGGTLDFVRELRKQNISIGVVFFEHNAALFTRNAASIYRFRNIVNQLHLMKLRVVTSVDTFVRNGTLEFDECMEHSFLLPLVVDSAVPLTYPVHDGFHEGMGILDFTNAEALQWYRRRLDKVLQTGIDGVWNEPMDGVISTTFGRGVQGRSGFVDSALYADEYYYQTFDYGRAQKGFDFVTSFLAVGSLSRELVLRVFGPTDISFAAMVKAGSFSLDGLEDAVVSLKQSAEKGYINVGVEPTGSIEGGVDTALRWVQLMSLCPVATVSSLLVEHVKAHSPVLFETFFSEVQRLTELHETLRPYYYSLGSLMFFHQFLQRQGTSQKGQTPFVMRPVEVKNEGRLHGFNIGMELFFVPVIGTAPTGNRDLRVTQTVSVTFPAGLGPWIPHAASQLPIMVYTNGSEVEFHLNATQFLLFQRGGGIIPTQRSSFSDAVTLLVESPHLSYYPLRYLPEDLSAEDMLALHNKEFAFFYNEVGKRHIVWYNVEHVGEHFWLNINNTFFGAKTIVCVRGATLTEDKSVDSGYTGAISLSHFAELVAGGIATTIDTMGEVCLYTPLMAVESVARIGPMKSRTG